MFAHTHIVHGSSVVHSHLGGDAEHNHDDSQYAVIDILSNFQSEGATGFIAVPIPFFTLADSSIAYTAPSYVDEVVSVRLLRGPPQA